MIFVNFKTYPQATGENAVKLAITCEALSDELNIPIIPIVQATDLWRITQHIHTPVWLQHVDHADQGATTGFSTVEAALTNGAEGVLLNHSERQIDRESLIKVMERIRSTTTPLKTMVCVTDIAMIESIKTLQPDWIAFEPPELIGSKDHSVATQKADSIAQGVQAAAPIPLSVGAGIKSQEDVRISIAKGAQSILVASSVVLSEHPDDVLRTLSAPFMKN